MDIKKLLNTHLLTIFAIISIISLAMPFVIIKSEVEVLGQSINKEVVINGFQALNTSLFTLILIIAPALVATMNYIKPIENYKGIIAIVAPVVCIVSLIIVFFTSQKRFGGSQCSNSWCYG